MEGGTAIWRGRTEEKRRRRPQNSMQISSFLSSVLVLSSRTLYQVQHMLGKAFFEMADYPRAQKALEDMQQVGRGGEGAGRGEGGRRRLGQVEGIRRERGNGHLFIYILAQLGVSSSLNTPYLSPFLFLRLMPNPLVVTLPFRSLPPFSPSPSLP